MTLPDTDNDTDTEADTDKDNDKVYTTHFVGLRIDLFVGQCERIKAKVEYPTVVPGNASKFPVCGFTRRDVWMECRL